MRRRMRREEGKMRREEGKMRREEGKMRRERKMRGEGLTYLPL